MTTEQISPRPNSSLAIISLISGVLGVTLLPFIGSIIAVITAPMAKKEIQESDGTLAGEEIAKIGQILGWIGIALSLVGCCCVVIVLLPVLATLLAAFGIIIDSSWYYYWLVPGLAGLIF